MILIVLIASKSNGQQENGVFRIDSKFPQCKSSVSIEAKEQCIKRNCIGQQSLFECQALECKLKFPTTPDNLLSTKLKRLRCIKNNCISNPFHLACTGLENCKKLRDQPLGTSKFIVCITKLFPKCGWGRCRYCSGTCSRDRWDGPESCCPALRPAALWLC